MMKKENEDDSWIKMPDKKRSPTKKKWFTDNASPEAWIEKNAEQEKWKACYRRLIKKILI